ncbi:MBL fold metallo-hydrolase [Selenomonas sp.]|jgi:L-ascorbate metabolism protein UlaG (beta-lactamase superfamily)|uniref:MBL fold metallo-hydrolase n=1 Tax=Selenomonas sp. TaxID=2053611 RepID=UPI003A101BF2
MTRREFIVAGLGLLGTAAAGGAYAYVHLPKFGNPPTGERLRRMQASPHYHGDHFENLVPVSVMSEEEGEHENRLVATWKFLFGDKTGLVPDGPLPTQKTDLSALSRERDAVVWLGHSSFFVQLGGYRILIDPVFSSYASPLWCINRAFAGSNVYTADDFPEIDVLALSHDHWDHLDYSTVMALKPKVRQVVCPLGVGAYFEQWGYPAGSIHEEDWGAEIKLEETLSVHILPSQHFSGRFLKQNLTLWCGMAFLTPKRSLYYTGDGGYGAHFQDIGRTFGGFDCVLAENGQYNLAWHAIHMLPEETAQACDDVGARLVIPAHNSKFALARHPWQEPMVRLEEASRGRSYRLLTPKIGALIDLASPADTSDWWRG